MCKAFLMYLMNCTFSRSFAPLVNIVSIGLIVALILFSPVAYSQGALKAEFYSGKNFERYVSTQSADNIDLFWETKSPVPGMDPGKCSIRWTGSIKPPVSGEYRFSAKVDYGIRLWIDEELVIDDWTLHDWGRLDGRIKLESDTYYNFKVEYFNAMFGGEIRLRWDLPEDGNTDKRNKGPAIIDSKYFHETQKKVGFDKGLEKIYASNSSGEIPTSKPKKRKIVEKKKEKPKVSSRVSQPKVLEEISNSITPYYIAKEKMTKKIIELYTPQSVHFERAQAVILEDSKEELNVLVEFLKLNSYLETKIEGHTDLAGDPQKNMELSERRAYAVARYLVVKGVKASGIDAKGMGGTKPLIQSKGKLYHPENRRVSFIISIP